MVHSNWAYRTSMSELPVSVGLASEFRVQVRSTSRGTSVEGAGRLVDIPASRLPSHRRREPWHELPNWFSCDVRRKKEKAKPAKADFGKGWAKSVRKEKESCQCAKSSRVRGYSEGRAELSGIRVI